MSVNSAKADSAPGNEKALRSLWGDFLIMLAVPVAVAWYYYGTRVFKLLFVGIISAVVFELIVCKLKLEKQTLGDLNAVFIGAALTLMLPASSPLWLPIPGVAVAIFAVKYPFGGTSHVPFSPVAAGMAFLTICFPSLVFAYPAIASNGGTVSAYATQGYEQGQSLSSMLMQGSTLKLNIISVFDVLSGNIPGAMGVTCILLLFGCMIYLIIRRPRLFVASAGFILSSALVALLFPRILRELLSTISVGAGAGYHLTSLVLELSAGYIFYASVFLITDPATLPPGIFSRFLCGFCGGFICMMMRYFGEFEEPTCFAVLIINAFWPVADKYIDRLGVYIKSKVKTKNKGGEVTVSAESGT